MAGKRDSYEDPIDLKYWKDQIRRYGLGSNEDIAKKVIFKAFDELQEQREFSRIRPQKHKRSK